MYYLTINIGRHTAYCAVKLYLAVGFFFHWIKNDDGDSGSNHNDSTIVILSSAND